MLIARGICGAAVLLFAAAAASAETINGNVPGRRLALGQTVDLSDFTLPTRNLVALPVLPEVNLNAEQSRWTGDVAQSILDQTSHESIDLRFSAKYLSVSGDAVFSRFVSRTSNTQSLTAWAEGWLDLGQYKLDAFNPQVVPEVAGLKVKNLTPDQVRRFFGTHIVSEVTLTARVTFWITLETKAGEKVEDMHAALKLAASGLAAKATFEGEVNKAARELLQSGRLSVSFSVGGGDRNIIYDWAFPGTKATKEVTSFEGTKSLQLPTTADVVSFEKGMRDAFAAWLKTVKPANALVTQISLAPLSQYLANAHADGPKLGELESEIRDVLLQYQFLETRKSQAMHMLPEFGGLFSWVLPEDQTKILRQASDIRAYWRPVSTVYLEMLGAAPKGTKLEDVKAALVERFKSDATFRDVAVKVTRHEAELSLPSAFPQVEVKKAKWAEVAGSAFEFSLEVRNALPYTIGLRFKGKDAPLVDFGAGTTQLSDGKGMSFSKRIEPGQSGWEAGVITSLAKAPNECEIVLLIPHPFGGGLLEFWRGRMREE